MTILTRDFGELAIDEQEIISFCSPIYGFEELKNFVLLYDDSFDSSFSWLQSTEQAQICFILADPAAVASEYRPTIPAADRRTLGLKNGEEPVLRVILVISENACDATMNLKSPIVINPAKKCAAQVILEEDYPVRARLVVGEEEALC